MSLNKERARKCLKNFAFKELFIEELGWDPYEARPLHVTIDGSKYSLTGLVEKRGMVVFECSPDNQGAIPNSGVRRKIDNQVRKSSVEHIVIYADAAKTRQKWQWLRREKGKPLASREHEFALSQSGEALLQKLSHLEIGIDEESDITIFGVLSRAKSAFDVDRVTKKFYERFRKEHDLFLKFIKGIKAQADSEWYASLMLNRLMFCYFIQKKGFLDGDDNYLRNRLEMVQNKKGKDKFLNFYRHFLLRLFHEGLGNREHSRELDELIGKVPYLNGGFFDVHKLEEQYPDIEITDSAFEKVFDFFDEFHWHLDDRPLRDDKEINPDVLGYIFEKYINQKQMGAYYTKEDITGYISKNTIIPWLFDAAKKKCTIAFQPASSLWRLLKNNPDHYLYPAMRRGVIADTEDVSAGRAIKSGEIIPLPKQIESGVKDVSKRGNWNTPCSDGYGLPTEIWREHVARRERCLEIRQKMQEGEICDINDLITYNLDIVQFAEEIIQNCEGPELLRAFYDAITSISILDPTCGSGAFLFAALNILESLYDACLDRMSAFIGDADHVEPGNKKYPDFRKQLESMAKHPSREYFIYKSIIINNLFGVDIMEEAVEICKLRLFLKLVAQVDTAGQIEPLPDIDFNIRAGNTLIGYSTIASFKSQSLSNVFVSENKFNMIIEEAEKIGMEFEIFKSGQLEDRGQESHHRAKKHLNNELENLNEQLNHFLAASYLGSTFSESRFNDWKKTHQPFYWFAEFYDIMHNGGFDVVIGNPPYVKTSKIAYTFNNQGYKSLAGRNIYSLVIERSYSISSKQSYIGMITPVSICSGNGFKEIMELLFTKKSWLSSFSNRPGKLFDGVEQRLSIFISSRIEQPCLTSPYQHWYSEERNTLFERLSFFEAPILGGIPLKAGIPIANSILSKIINAQRSIQLIQGVFGECWYHDGPTYWIRSLPFYPSGNASDNSSHYHCIKGRELQSAHFITSILASSTFYLFYKASSNCRDFGSDNINSFRINDNIPDLSEIVKDYRKRLKATAIQCSRSYPSGTIEYDEYYPAKSKDIIDQIDIFLARHYGFTNEELDYIINYDIKYRMGDELDNGPDEE